MASDAATFGFDGQVLTHLMMAGASIDAVVICADDEIRRRESVGLGAVVDRDLLDALGQLPLGWPVQIDDLDPVARVIVEGGPPGLVERDGGSIVRRYQPALHPSGVLLRRRNWKKGIEEISRFAAVAPRGLVVIGSRLDLHEALDSAQRLGIGLAVGSDRTRPSELLTPHSNRFRRPGTSAWLFAEELFAEWRNRRRDQTRWDQAER